MTNAREQNNAGPLTLCVGGPVLIVGYWLCRLYTNTIIDVSTLCSWYMVANTDDLLQRCRPCCLVISAHAQQQQHLNDICDDLCPSVSHHGTFHKAVLSVPVTSAQSEFSCQFEQWLMCNFIFLLCTDFSFYYHILCRICIFTVVLEL